MRSIIKYILLICFIILAPSTQSKTDIRYGLLFKSYEVEKEERTSLNLTSEGNFSFPNGFTMEFDVSFRRAHYSFGYIFRLINFKGEHIDLLLTRSSRETGLEPQFTAIYQSGQVLCDMPLKDMNASFEEWIHIKILIDPKKELFMLILNEKEFEITNEYFQHFNDVNIVFGKNNSITYQTSDVSTMSIKDIVIKNLKGKELYYWPLNQHVQNGVYDQVKKRFAYCENPDWLIDQHSSWHKVTSFTTGIYPEICFIPQTNTVAVADKQALHLYNVIANTLENEVYNYGFPSGSNDNQLLYNSLYNELFTYNFTDEISAYNSENKTWNNDKIEPSDPVYWHHNRFFSVKDTSLYTFGGYGFHLYKNDINKYHIPTKTWSKSSYKGESISPRYLSGLGVVNDSIILLFGGYGSEEGGQQFAPHNYYDLYSYNTETSETNKIWELNQTDHNFVVANSLVVDTLDNCFYALCFLHQKFNTNIKLYRFSLTKPEYEILADSIPFQFNDVFSYADLYLTIDRKQLVAVTAYTDKNDEKATVSVFTLAFPPLHKTDLFQKETTGTTYQSIIAGIIIILIAIFLYIQWKKKKKKKVPVIIEDVVEDSGQNSNNSVIDLASGLDAITGKPVKQSIFLLGGFQVIDKDSNVITGEFTLILKQLFLITLLYTLKDGKGISSVRLRETLWFDKSTESAKNNRGVSLTRLRRIFNKIGDISILAENSYWKIHFGEDIYCDYCEVLILMDRLSVNPDINDIKKLVSLVSVGELLPNLQTEWLDPFKSNFSNKLIDLLLHIISESDKIGLTQTLMIDIADAIFAHDSLNEDALKIKCTLLVEMGKNGLAQKTYTSFIKEYQSLFATDFKYTFEQIIS